MRRFSILFFVCVISFLSNLQADNVPVVGFWEDDRIDSIAVIRPEVNINGNIVSIYSPKSLFGLEVIIYNDLGSVVWQQTLSLESGDVIELPVFLEEGEYVIKMSHYWRYLIGEFEVC